VIHLKEQLHPSLSAQCVSHQATEACKVGQMPPTRVLRADMGTGWNARRLQYQPSRAPTSGEVRCQQGSARHPDQG
ncbi:hypothetical protein NDU88_007107, partial [Pleurodeles waltl]